MDCWGPWERERESLWKECSGLKPVHAKQQLCWYVLAIYRTFKLLNSFKIWENFLNTCLNNFVTELKPFSIEFKLFQIHSILVDRQQSIYIFNSMQWFTEMQVTFFYQGISYLPHHIFIKISILNYNFYASDLP